MSEKPPITEGQEATEELSDKDKKKIVFLSYKFSQGSAALQKKILSFVRNWYGDPCTNFEKEFKTILNTVDNVIKKGHHFVLDEAEKKGERAEQISSLKALDGSVVYSFESDELAKSMVEKDKRWLITKEGRPGGDRSDKMMSFVLYYGRDGHTTGMEVYDDMMSKIWEACQDTDDKEILSKLDILKDVHVGNMKKAKENLDSGKKKSGGCPFRFGE